jgi:hypothetical protein
MSFSTEVAKEPLDSPTPRVTSAPASKFGSPPNYYASSIVSKDSQQNTNVAAGRLPEEVYAGTLPSWRAALRRQCVARVVWESEVIAELQVCSPFLSLYFEFEQEITGKGAVSLAGHVLFIRFDARYTYLLPCISPYFFLLRTRRHGERVRI